MRKIAFLIFILSVSVSYMFGQKLTDTISYTKNSNGYLFYKGTQVMNLNEAVNAMKSNELAYNQIKSAQSNYNLAMVFNYAGGFMVGWPIGTALGGGKPNWKLAVIGAGLILVTIPINQDFNIKVKQAIDTYNKGLQSTSFIVKPELMFAITENGVGFRLAF